MNQFLAFGPKAKRHRIVITIQRSINQLGKMSNAVEDVFVGAHQYPVTSHRPSDECCSYCIWYSNFQGYTTHKDSDILAFGTYSISQTADVYMQNEKNLKRYQERVAATGFAVERGIKLSRDDQIRRDAITRVMCDLQLDFAAFDKEWEVAFGDYFADALAGLRPLADDGLVNIAADRISVTPTGRLFLRNIGMCFDRYLKEAASDKPRYSQTA